VPGKSLRLVPASKDISKKFLLYALRTKEVRRVFEEQATGVSESMRNISQGKIQSAPIPLAPVNMQNRIVAKMESMIVLRILLSIRKGKTKWIL